MNRLTGGPPALTASVSRVVPTTSRLVTAKPQDWQDLAWRSYDEVGEVRYGVDFRANQFAKVTLFVAERDEDGEPQPLEGTDGARANEALARLEGDLGGHGEILRELSVQMQVPGEGYLVGKAGENPRADEQGLAIEAVESWEIRSTDELEVTSDGYRLIDEPGAKGKGDLIRPDELFVLRIWNPHPRFSRRANSPIRSVLGVIEEIRRVDQAITAAALSRAALAGLLVIDESVGGYGTPDPTTESSSDGEERNDPVTDAMVTAFTTAIQNPGSAAGIMPIVLRAQVAERGIDNLIKRVELGIDIPDKLMERDNAIRRLAQGLDIPPEIVTGMSDVNHWNAWLIDEQTWKDHGEPGLLRILAALTKGYLRPALIEAGFTPERAGELMVGYDASNLISHPNAAKDASEGVNLGAVGRETWRRVHGFDDADAATPEDLDLLLEIKGRRNDPSGERGTPPQERSSGSVASLVLVGSAAEDLGQTLMAIDRDLRERLTSAADAQVKRALDKAGNKIRSKVRGSDASQVIDGLEASAVAARLGRTFVAERLGFTTDEIVEEALAPLRDRFFSWTASASERAARALGMTETFSSRFSAAREEAWSWFASALGARTVELLFDPSPDAEFGEIAAGVLVGPGLAREALARAGGTLPVHEGSALWLSLGEIPAGGIATGQIAMDYIGATGGGVGAWRWVYGEAVRTQEFEPHRRLNGLEFTSWTDERLANLNGWPANTHYVPGDHRGCICDYLPLVSIGGAVAEDLSA